MDMLGSLVCLEGWVCSPSESHGVKEGKGWGGPRVSSLAWLSLPPGRGDTYLTCPLLSPVQNSRSLCGQPTLRSGHYYDPCLCCQFPKTPQQTQVLKMMNRMSLVYRPSGVKGPQSMLPHLWPGLPSTVQPLPGHLQDWGPIVSSR